MSYFDFPNTRNYDSDLGWIIKKIKESDNQISTLLECCDQVKNQITDLEAFKQSIENADFPQPVIDAFNTWMFDNLTDIVGELVKGVYFGLNDYGYFIAYIPTSWDAITFNTTEYDIVVDVQPQLGHLVLSY